MNKKQQRTLARVFATPTPTNIVWRDIESLFRALGATIEEAEGSRVMIKLQGRRLIVHRPHPRPETKRGAVRAVRDFLKQVNIKP